MKYIQLNSEQTRNLKDLFVIDHPEKEFHYLEYDPEFDVVIERRRNTEDEGFEITSRYRLSASA
jgi:hypothetical protein